MALLPWQQAWNTGVTVDSQVLAEPCQLTFLRLSVLTDCAAVQTLAANLFASSIVPYAGFLWHLHRSRQAPRLTLFGFYWYVLLWCYASHTATSFTLDDHRLLVFVGVTIPAGIIAKTQYNTSLSNVDWLHGGAESMLTLTNLFIVLGLRQGIRQAQERSTQRLQQAESSEQLSQEQPSEQRSQEQEPVAK